MTKLLQRRHDALVRRHYATTTRESYLKIVKACHRHTGRRLDRIGPDDLRRYQVFLLEERKLAVGTVVAQIAALRFFFLRVLKRRDMNDDLPYPKHRRRLPGCLSSAFRSRKDIHAIGEGHAAAGGIIRTIPGARSLDIHN